MPLKIETHNRFQGAARRQPSPIRRARMGASMQGPNYTQWHGFYEVVKHFYFKFLPEAEELSPGIEAQFVKGPDHERRKGMNKAQIQKMLDFYQKRYGQ